MGGSLDLCWRSWLLLGFSWRSWAAIGAAVCDPGPLLEPILVVLGLSWGLSLRSAAALWAYVGGLGLKNSKDRPTLKMCLFLERERDLRLGGQSWGALEPMLTVLGCSWGVCWRSWAALGPYVGDLGPLLGPLLAIVGRSWGLCWRSWARLGRKVALARAGRRSGSEPTWPRPP